MTDTKKLNAMIALKGVKKKDLAAKIGISYMALNNKIKAESDFKSKEIKITCIALGMTVSEMLDIFFEGGVDKDATKEVNNELQG